MLRINDNCDIVKNGRYLLSGNKITDTETNKTIETYYIRFPHLCEGEKEYCVIYSKPQTQVSNVSYLFWEKSNYFIGWGKKYGGAVYRTENGDFIEECPGTYSWVSTGGKWRKIKESEITNK